jgi:hypothetical protein
VIFALARPSQKWLPLEQQKMQVPLPLQSQLPFATLGLQAPLTRDELATQHHPPLAFLY